MRTIGPTTLFIFSPTFMLMICMSFIFLGGNLTIQCSMLLTLVVVDVSHVFVREAFAFIISWFCLLGHCH